MTPLGYQQILQGQRTSAIGTRPISLFPVPRDPGGRRSISRWYLELDMIETSVVL
jgi:hypothetical protein